MSDPSADIASAASRLAHKELLREAAYIDGVWVADGIAGSYPVYNPSTGELLATVPKLDGMQTVKAVEAAGRAFERWRRLSAKERCKLIRCWYEHIIRHQADLAALIVMEEGKPLAEARAEISYAASFVEWFAEEARRIRGDVMESPEADRRIVTLREPVGVCAGITPWNFPAAMITRKVAPALAAGCTILIKPAEQTPLTALALAALGQEAGLPAGVFNVLTGDAVTIGAALTSHPTVRKLTFTGSTEVGRLLLAQSAATVKKVSMELGGNAPFIVMNDANVVDAVTGLIATKFRNTGQACISANRIYVQSGIHDVFVRTLTQCVAQLKVGDGFESGVQLGPLIDNDALAKVEAHMADATGRGATVTTGGRRHGRGGTFFEPTVVQGVAPDMRFCQEETFGPVAPVVQFEHAEDVIRLANDSQYGLAAYLFASDARCIWHMASRLEAGMVGINTGAISSEVVPFGGVKQSGLGREGSAYGIDEYLELKALVWNGSRPT